MTSTTHGQCIQSYHNVSEMHFCVYHSQKIASLHKSQDLSESNIDPRPCSRMAQGTLNVG